MLLLGKEKDMEDIKKHISMLRGLISYHERMTVVCESTYKVCYGQNGSVRPINAECSLKPHCDMYIDAIRSAVKLLEGDTSVTAEELDESIVIIRCLIGYHKAVNNESPKAEGDIYLEALESALRITNERITAFEKPDHLVDSGI